LKTTRLTVKTLIAAVLALCAGLLATGGISAASASPLKPVRAVTVNPPPTYTGSLDLSLTSPVTISTGPVPAPVACSVSSTKTYSASLGPVSYNGYSVAASVRILGYRGPATYTGTLILTLTVPGSSTPLPIPVTSTPVTVASDLSAVASFSNTTTSTPVAGTLSWVCSS
jgi:hypothetical protein